MSFFRETGIQLTVAAAAFLVGLLLTRARSGWYFVKARTFWRPLLSRDLALVLGDGFTSIQKIEASRLVARGDLLASYELSSRFSGMGFSHLRPVFADAVVGQDSTGSNLRRNLIVIGGSDANTLSAECMEALRCCYRPRWQPDGGGELPELYPTPEETELCSYRPFVVADRVVRDYGVIVRARNPFLPQGENHKKVVLIYGCYGFGTLAAALFAHNDEFIRLVDNQRDDIECIVECAVVKGTPQAIHPVYFRALPEGALSEGGPIS